MYQRELRPLRLLLAPHHFFCSFGLFARIFAAGGASHTGERQHRKFS
jgi:hypothetical protein